MKLLFTIFVVLFKLGFVYSQFSLSLGTSISKPDVRTEFLEDRYGVLVVDRIRADNPTYDNEFFVSLLFFQPLHKRLHINSGVGISVIHNDFNMVIEWPKYFVEPGIPTTAVIVKNDWYFNYNTMLNLEPSIDIYKKGNIAISFGINNVFNLSFYKHFYNSDDKETLLNKFKFNPYSFEVFPNIGVRYKRLGLHFGYRLVNMKFRDPALVNNGLKHDFYNPLKFRMRLSYNIFNMKKN